MMFYFVIFFIVKVAQALISVPVCFVWLMHTSLIDSDRGLLSSSKRSLHYNFFFVLFCFVDKPAVRFPSISLEILFKNSSILLYAFLYLI